MARINAPHHHNLALTVAVLLIAAFLRAHLLGLDGRFHPDEALFAAFARDAAVRGEWLLPGNLDKTPLSIYLQAALMLVMGNRWDGAVWVLDVQQGEFVARLVGVYTGVLLVALTGRLAHTLTRSRGAAVTAALLVALSPYGIAFSASAFTDMPMVLFGVLALWAAVTGRGVWAGVALALAYACKQQGLLFAPLVVGASWRTRRCAPLEFGGAFAAVIAPLIVWDAMRPYPSVLLLAFQNNAPDAPLVPPGEWLPRIGAWWALLRWMFGGALLTGVVLLLAAWGTVRGPALLRWLGAYVVGYGLLHLLVPLNVYDRYVLPVVPLVAILAAWGLVAVGRFVANALRISPANTHKGLAPLDPLFSLCIADRTAGCRAGKLCRGVGQRPMLPLLLAILLTPGAWAAANNTLPIGADKGQHDGIIALADYLNGREFGAIVYDRWLGWQLNYYLGGWSDKRRAYYPTPQQMATDPALTVPDVAPRYLPAPRTADVTPWLAALGEAGFTSCVGYRDANFVVYVLSRPTADGETSASALARAACYRHAGH